MAVIEIDRHPEEAKLRWFAGLQAVFMAWAAWQVHRRTGWVLGPVMVVALAGLVGLCGLARPAFVRLYYIGWMLAVFPIGWLVSHVVLAVSYYLVFTPVGFIMRMLGHDPLNLRFDRTAPTYWIERTQERGVDDYFRQF